MVVSELLITFGAINPQQIILPSFHARVDIAVIVRVPHALLITLVNVEGRVNYVDRVTPDLGLTFLITIVLQKLEDVITPYSSFVLLVTVFVTPSFGCTYQQLRGISKEFCPL